MLALDVKNVYFAINICHIYYFLHSDNMDVDCGRRMQCEGKTVQCPAG